ncbi:MCE family protein [Spongisporangium articulatum]|uniref:MCE family protein n=1 Tax=Spongisporangium articulatum TaxID=3362603 RepID=A0ABW8ATI5_9ACTN
MKALTAVVCALVLTGCSGGLPFAAGSGGDGYEIQVQMSDVHNLVRNAEVKVADVTVGAVTAIRLEGWNAELTVRLQPDVSLPADAQARVATKSLLGAQYLELLAPTPARGADPAAMPRLTPGSTIPLAHTGAYPETEDLLIALSTLLNGGGLGQIRTITTELNYALDGRGPEIRRLLERLQRVTAELNDQRGRIDKLLSQLDGLGATLAAEGTTVRRALPALAPGLAALQAQLPQLTKTLTTVTDLNTVLTPVLAANQDGLVREVRRLVPALKGVADAGDDIVPALDMLPTLIYPTSMIKRSVFGDYQNIYPEVDVKTRTLLNNFSGGARTGAGGSSTVAVRGANGSGDATPSTTQLFAPTTREGT